MKIVDVVSLRRKKKLLIRVSLLESKRELEKLGRPQSQQIHMQELLVFMSGYVNREIVFYCLNSNKIQLE